MNNRIKDKKRINEEDRKEIQQPKPRNTRRLSRVLVLFILFGFLVFAWFSTRNENDSSVFKRLDQVKSGEKSFMIIVQEKDGTLSGENKDMIKEVVAEAGKEIEVFSLMYNVEKPGREALYFIDSYDLESLPTLALVNGKNIVVKRYTLPFQKDEILEVVAKLTKEDESRDGQK